MFRAIFPMLLAIIASSLLAFLLLELLGIKFLLFAIFFLGIFLLLSHFLCQEHLNALKEEIQNAPNPQNEDNPFHAVALKRLLLILVEQLAKSYPPCRILQALKELLKGSKEPKGLNLPFRPSFSFIFSFFMPQSMKEKTTVEVNK